MGIFYCNLPYCTFQKRNSDLSLFESAEKRSQQRQFIYVAENINNIKDI